jgi:hypothetical protein
MQRLPVGLLAHTDPRQPATFWGLCPGPAGVGEEVCAHERALPEQSQGITMS